MCVRARVSPGLSQASRNWWNALDHMIPSGQINAGNYVDDN